MWISRIENPIPSHVPCHFQGIGSDLRQPPDMEEGDLLELPGSEISSPQIHFCKHFRHFGISKQKKNMKNRHFMAFQHFEIRCSDDLSYLM